MFVTPINLIVIITLLINLILGLIIFLKDKRNPINRIFGCIVFCIVLWILSIFMFRTSRNINNAFFWVKVSNGVTGFIPPLFLLFSLVFPRKKIKISVLFKIVLVVTPIVFLIIGFLNLIASKVILVDYVYSPISGALYPLFVLYFVIFFILAFRNLSQSYKYSRGVEKLQIKYLFTGTLVTALIGMISNLILPIFGISALTDIGPSATIILVVFTTYAVFRHHLFNIKVIATELLVGLVSLTLLVDLLLSKTLLTGLIKGLILVAFVYLGWSLIRSVLQEIARREKVEGLSKELRRAYQELKKVDTAKTEFISMASHQLRTPLSAIKGYVSMILEGTYGHVPKKMERPLKNVFISNERLIGIVGDLLNISKIELGKVEMDKEKTRVEKIISEVLQEMKLQADEKNVKLIWKKPRPRLPEIEIDKLKIRQVILNLVDNALKYTQKGEVEVKAEKVDSKIQILVRDTGAGLTNKEKSGIFESFTRGSAGTALWIEGAGLGLFVAKKYMELHGGKIWVESEGKGKGSTFYVELPLE